MVKYFTGAVMVPGSVCNGVVITSEVVLKAYQVYESSEAFGKFDIDHDNIDRPGIRVISSFITKHKSHHGPAGTWVLCLKVDNEEVSQKLDNHEINAFSIHGFMPMKKHEQPVERVDKALLKTLPVNKHSHLIFVKYGPSGSPEEIKVSASEGHTHNWNSSTCTTTRQNGHRHRVSRPQPYKTNINTEEK
jgi:hypothetical protein